MESSAVFEEWNTYAKRKKLLPRKIGLDSIISNANSKIVAITGVRRCGKSSLLMLLAQRLEQEGKKVAYVNVEDSRIKDNLEVLDEALKWFGEDGFLLLDEITSASDWQGWLARNHELLKGRLRLIVSSSRKSLMTPSKPLRGRVLPLGMFPLSFGEYLSFKGLKVEKTTSGRGRLEKAFAEYMKYGGFPEVALASEEVDKILILNSYFKDIVGLDVAEASKQDVGTVEAFGKYAIQAPYFSASKCLNFFKTIGYKIGKEKLLELEQYSQASFLFFFTPIFSYNIKDKSQYPRKAYCGDTGFYYSTTGKMDFGRLYENLAFLELKRRTQGEKELCYWKSKEGFETDIVVKQGANVSEAIQVVYDLKEDKTLKREVRGLTECCKELKPTRATILTKDVKQTKTIEGIKINFVPLIDWLQSVD
ncbi:TPA: ATP-binding protein [Candidatus Micrarchaeota archaeon]|nr:ATP-binding protein [Candidatus Micrarchaeota archaeon]